ncbi:unnamed protein product [Mytilus edulis]|uniref:VLIG-type G domain-containing protein n=1 Tax=Mytilus edulis TaxID=6550 RepID=A0A8S3S125_MYTED|nr:unnamed protein product [Mytilus edulis]
MSTIQDSDKHSNEKDKTEKDEIQMNNSTLHESMTSADAKEHAKETQFENILRDDYGLDPKYWLAILKTKKYKKDDAAQKKTIKDVFDEIPIDNNDFEETVRKQLGSLTASLKPEESRKAARQNCSLDDKIKNLQHASSSNAYTRTKLNVTDIISHASSGCALRGIFLNHSLDEITEMKETVISLVGDITLQGPSLKQEVEFLEFSSRKRVTTFKSLYRQLENMRSHINTGILHFGGIFKWTATYTSLTESKSDFNKDLVYDTLEGFLNIGYAGPGPTVGIGVSGKSLSSISGISNKHTEEELSKIQLIIDSIGGPPDEIEYQKWVQTLTAENETWSLISRGNFIGIWEVLTNHQDDFCETCNLTSLLECCWNMEMVESSHEQSNSKDYELLLFTLRQTLDKLADLTGDEDYFKFVLESNVKIQTFLEQIAFSKELQNEMQTAIMQKRNLRIIGSCKTCFLERQTEIDVMDFEINKRSKDLPSALSTEQINNIEFFISELEQTINKFDNLPVKYNVQKQANLVNYIVNTISQNTSKSSEEIFNTCFHALKTDLENDIVLIIELHTKDSPFNWIQLQDDLQPFIDGTATHRHLHTLPDFNISLDLVEENHDENFSLSMSTVPEKVVTFLKEMTMESEVSLIDSITIHARATNKKKENLLWFLFLRIMTQHSTLYEILEQHVKGFDDKEKVTDTDDFNICDDTEDDLLLNLTDNVHSCVNINPLDLVVALFVCSSKTLKQALASKMHSCRLAVPFVLPDRFSTTASVSLLKSILLSTAGNKYTPADDCPCNILSFIRIGCPNISKSQIINDIISNENHAVFFNRFSPFGHAMRTFSEDNESLENDSTQHLLQTVLSPTTTGVVMIDAHQRTKTYVKEFVIKYKDILKDNRNIHFGVIALGGKQKRTLEVKYDICSKMKTFFKKKQEKALVLILEESKIVVDNEGSQNGKKVIYEMRQLIDKFSNTVSLKRDVLQLQGTTLTSLKFSSCKTENTNRVEVLKEDVDNSESDLLSTPLGFEHFIREIGQVYEAILDQASRVSDETINFAKWLPKVPANLLLAGLPFEVMNGDIIHVPIVWVTAVLNELSVLIGDKKCLILSVVGIQSSGKSTLLNMMFGLQFPVGHGRITKGAFMQLIPVNDERLSFEIIVVIDTEGLRASELGHENYKHDNEFATFIMGIADINIVNINGESQSEMTEVLQMVVHAHLKMKTLSDSLNMKHSCIFVHQNVKTDDGTNDALAYSLQRMINLLDDMTLEAANQLEINDIESFKQVIDFDKKHVWYLPNLYTGELPIIRVNPSYSRRIENIKETILFDIATRHTHFTITDTSSKIEDMWNGILSEDFAFNFKNNLEARAYTKLESHYQELYWRLESAMHTFVRKKKLSLFKCKSESEFDVVMKTARNEFTKISKNEFDKTKDDFDAFIDNSTLKNIMLKWKQGYRLKLQSSLQSISERSDKQILSIKDEIKQVSDCERSIKDCEDEINSYASELAGKLANESKDNTEAKISIKILTDRFEQEWISWRTKCSTTQIGCEESEQILDLSVLTGCLNLEKSEVCINQTVDFTDKLGLKIESFLTKRQFTDDKFNEIDISYILNLVENEIENHNKHKDNDYKFRLTLQYKAMVLTNIAAYCTKVFIDINRQYDQRHNPQIKLEEYKDTAFELFVGLVHKKTEDVIAGNFFQEAIKSCILEQVQEDLPNKVEDEVLKSFEYSKYKVMKSVMKDLIDKNNFDHFSVYITSPDSYVEMWVRNYANTYLFQNDGHKFGSLCKFIVENALEDVNSAVNNATEIVKARYGSRISTWIDEFISSCKYLPISKKKTKPC